MYKVNNTLTSAYGDIDMANKQGPVSNQLFSFSLCIIKIYFPTYILRLTDLYDNLFHDCRTCLITP